FHDLYAESLYEDASHRYTFTYHPDYVEAGQPSIARNLPLTVAPRFSDGLHPYFDNLVAEGWLAGAQARAGSSAR
ncbi:MAG TPA: HipA N-terminal domain-containing protein, partial [Bryobacteraceae bacterium]